MLTNAPTEVDGGPTSTGRPDCVRRCLQYPRSPLVAVLLAPEWARYPMCPLMWPQVRLIYRSVHIPDPEEGAPAGVAAPVVLRRIPVIGEN